MKNIRLLIAFVGMLPSCSNDDSETNTEEFVPGEVSVGIKSGTNINEIFNFINQFDHKVEKINGLTFTSNLPSDSLQYILDFLNKKSYTNDKTNRFTTGYLHYQTNVITIFPKLFHMNNGDYQNDWLKSMETLRLKEKHTTDLNSSILLFHVTEGHERVWENRFENYDIVDWAELNYIADIKPLIN